MRYHKTQFTYQKRRWPWLAAFLGLGGLTVYLLVTKLPEGQPSANPLLPLKEEAAIVETPEQATIKPDLNLNDSETIAVPENLMPKVIKQDTQEKIADKENLGQSEAATGTKPVKPAVELDIPFVSQAPLGGWDDPAQQDGCEEASALMAIKWAQGEPLSAQEMIEGLRAAEEYQKDKIAGFHGDTSIQDTLDILLKDYFQWEEAEIEEIEGAEDIYVELEAGNPVMAPVDGRILANPHYTAPGPDHHMVLIIGYDYETKEFITNDPGTRYGASYRYSEDKLLRAIADYPTASERPSDREKRMIVTGKE